MPGGRQGWAARTAAAARPGNRAPKPAQGTGALPPDTLAHGEFTTRSVDDFGPGFGPGAGCRPAGAATSPAGAAAGPAGAAPDPAGHPAGPSFTGPARTARTGGPARSPPAGTWSATRRPTRGRAGPGAVRTDRANAIRGSKSDHLLRAAHSAAGAAAACRVGARDLPAGPVLREAGQRVVGGTGHLPLLHPHENVAAVAERLDPV